MGGKKRALQNTYRTGREGGTTIAQASCFRSSLGSRDFFGLSIRTSSLGDCYRALDQDLSWDSGLLSGSRSGPLSGVGTFLSSRLGPLSGFGTSFGLSIRTSLGSRDFFELSIRTSHGSGDFFRALDQDLSWESGLLLGSRSGPLLSGLLSMS
jgi:hypothetical protein